MIASCCGQVTIESAVTRVIRRPAAEKEGHLWLAAAAGGRADPADASTRPGIAAHTATAAVDERMLTPGRRTRRGTTPSRCSGRSGCARGWAWLPVAPEREATDRAS